MGIKLKLVIIPFIIYFAGVAGYTWYRYEMELEERLKEIDRRLEIGARQISNILPEDFPDRCRNTKSISKEEHFANMQRLNTAVASGGFEYLYTIHLFDGEMYYTATSYTEDEDPESEDLAYAYSLKESGESHYDEILKIFEMDKPLFFYNTDQWGEHRSCMVALKGKAGTVYIAGADYEVSYIQKELLKEVPISILTALLFLLLSTPFMYCVHRYWIYTSTEMKSLNKQLKDDVEYRKRVEQDLLRAKSQAEVAVETQKNFLANISHEIRTPMNGIVGMSTLLNSSNLNQEQMKSLDIIQKCSKHLLKIIEDLLNYSKIDALGVELQLNQTDICSVVRHSFEMLKELADSKEIKLTLNQKNQHCSIVTDEVRITQIITNLVSNAIKFSNSSEVSVELTRLTEKEGLLVKVIDQGVGIKADKLDEIFEPFKQLDNSTTRKFMGTGLGLAITKKLCEKLGGGIEVESEPGKGSVFSFTAYDLDKEK